MAILVPGSCCWDVSCQVARAENPVEGSGASCPAGLYLTSEPVPIPPLCKRIHIALMVVSTVQVRNMRYVVDRNRQVAAGQLIISAFYFLKIN
jgi:hypothetical protein